jgi:preprotein translocase subunit SecG
MLAFLLTVHMIVAIVLVALILIQRGKGADIGAAFGSGASQTVFGSRGSASFLTRTTAVLATLFFLSSLALSYMYNQRSERTSVTDVVAPQSETQTQTIEKPATKTPQDVPDVPTAPAAGGDEK